LLQFLASRVAAAVAAREAEIAEAAAAAKALAEAGGEQKHGLIEWFYALIDTHGTAEW